MYKWTLAILLMLLVVAAVAAPAAATESPVAVSPGNTSGLAVTGDACPTFSWGAVEDAKSYELVVYQLGAQGEEAQAVMRERFAGSVYSWTPSLDSCLERGGEYAWSVRAISKKGSSDWSPPSLFQVASGPGEAEFEEALQVVRQYLEEESTGRGDLSSPGGGTSSGASSATVAGPSARGSTADPATLSAVAGDSALQVNGSAVVTVATLAGVLCSTTEVRFLDQGDGTVLDCNTGKIWLKDASCLGVDAWAGLGGTSIFTKVADLNAGTEFNCSGYTAGTYTDWEVPAMASMCGLWNGSCTGTSCCTAGQGIVDTGFTPTVGNAAGDGQWMAEDAFVGVQSGGYWSATEVDTNNAWGVPLSNGFVNGFLKISNVYVWPVRVGQ